MFDKCKILLWSFSLAVFVAWLGIRFRFPPFSRAKSESDQHEMTDDGLLASREAYYISSPFKRPIMRARPVLAGERGGHARTRCEFSMRFVKSAIERVRLL